MIPEVWTKLTVTSYTQTNIQRTNTITQTYTHITPTQAGQLVRASGRAPSLGRPTLRAGGNVFIKDSWSPACPALATPPFWGKRERERRRWKGKEREREAGEDR